MFRLHQFPGSGNCYKVELMLNLLGEDYETVTIDLLKGESQTPEYFAINANGKTPTLQFPEGTYLPESNAILYYLAEGTHYFPADRLARAQVLQWMFFEQYSHEPYIATARYWVHIRKEPDHEMARLDERHQQGNRALGVMNQHLVGREYFVGGQCTIADLALFAYTHVAHQAGFDLTQYPAVESWLARIPQLSGYVEIPGGSS